VLASGDPRILQIQVDVTMGAEAHASTSGAGQASTSSSSTEIHPYGYAALRPTRFDEKGRITAFTLWPVQCGPPPKDGKGEELPLVTHQLLPGMEMKPGDTDCSTSSVSALRDAAKASEAWADMPRQARWLRDGDR
jgi:hypothetical protein